MTDVPGLMGFGVCAMTAVPIPAQISATNIAATGRANDKTCRDKPANSPTDRTMATSPPDAAGPVEAERID